jgi:hypothetical protein
MALSALLVALLALGWNVVSWWLGHMTRVRVTIEPTQMIIGEGPVQNLAIIVWNKSAHPVQAVAASFEFVDPGKKAIVHVPTPHPSQGIPGAVAARSMAMRTTPREDAEYQGLIGEPIYAWVQTADRDRPFRSKPVTIPADAWDGLPDLGRWRIVSQGDRRKTG